MLEIAEKIFQGQESWGTYNYCNSPVTTWHEFATKIVELGRDKLHFKTKQINKITTNEFPTKARRPKNSELLVAKINKDYGILRKDWTDFLAKVITSFEPSQQ
jgi:dTDP-4-dehydrorhamnose reductase